MSTNRQIDRDGGTVQASSDSAAFDGLGPDSLRRTADEAITQSTADLLLDTARRLEAGEMSSLPRAF